MNTLTVATLITIVVVISIVRYAIYRRNRKGNNQKASNKATLSELKSTMRNKAARLFDFDKNRILCERPAEMSFVDYRKHLLKQKKYIKARKRGTLVWESCRLTDRKNSKGIVEWVVIQVRGTFYGIASKLQ